VYSVRAGSAVVLLHVTRLAVALEPRVEVAVSRTVGVAADEPLGVGSLDGKAAHPLADAILDWERIGDVVARAADLGPREEHVVIAVMPARVHLLVRHRAPEDALQVAVTVQERFRYERAEPFGKPDRMRGEPEAAGADAISEVRPRGIGDGKRVPGPIDQL
jgi:hypothetical protein